MMMHKEPQQWAREREHHAHTMQTAGATEAGASSPQTCSTSWDSAQPLSTGLLP